MKTAGLVAVALLTTGSPLGAQIGGLGGVLKKAQEQKQKVDDLTFTDQEERQIGEDVSDKIRRRFGVVQDAAVHKYVTLVGTTVARASDRPNLPWTFIVLDTEGVNAFASPGGLVHITRGALGLIRNEAELAAVLGHEIGHVTRKHTINAIRKNKAVQIGTNQTMSNRAPLLDKVANKAYEMVLENSFDRGDELDADHVSVELTAKVGYLPASLADFLTRLDERNRNQPEKNGLFASHPETKERIEKVRSMGSASTSAALVEARYKAAIKYEAVSITAITSGADGSSGQSGKKKGFGVDSLNPTVAQEKPSTQVSASGGARGIGADRAAKGGDNPALVKTTVTDAELAAFKKAIV